MSEVVDATILYTRYVHAKEYLSAVVGSASWLGEYEHYREGTLSKARTMALLMPAFYGEGPREPNSLIRGRRSFKVVGRQDRCQSEMYWGYQCPFDNLQLSADHMFPYSLGGITEASNLIWLCSAHNRLKGSDVHVFPWERKLPEWVNGTLSQIAPAVRRLDSIL